MPPRLLHRRLIVDLLRANCLMSISINPLYMKGYPIDSLETSLLRFLSWPGSTFDYLLACSGTAHSLTSQPNIAQLRWERWRRNLLRNYPAFILCTDSSNFLVLVSLVPSQWCTSVMDMTMGVGRGGHLKLLAKRVVFIVLSGKKNKFHHFWPPGKLQKSPSSPPGNLLPTPMDMTDIVAISESSYVYVGACWMVQCLKCVRGKSSQ